MTDTPEWKVPGGQPFAIASVRSWSEYVALVETDLFDSPEYIYRGQRDVQWPLRSKFDREFRRYTEALSQNDPYKGLEEQELALVRQMNPKNLLRSRHEVLVSHLERFKAACYGRRGGVPRKLTDKEWWALGQHFGLATPLLDWTRSPYVGCFFALQEVVPSPSGIRALWVFSHDGFMENLINEEENLSKPTRELSSIESVEVLIDENVRLLSQGGLFTRTPGGEDIEEFIDVHISLRGMMPILYRIDIPESQRETFLRHLEAMNIHAGSLFPDLAGAAEYGNRGLEKEYSDVLWKQTPAFILRMLSNQCSHE